MRLPPAVGGDVCRQRGAPPAHGREAELFGERAAQRRVPRARRRASHLALTDPLDQARGLRSAQADEPRGLRHEIKVRADALVDDVVDAEAPPREYLLDAGREVFDVSDVGPRVDDGAHRPAREQLAVRRAEEVVFAGPENPGGADDVTARRRGQGGALAFEFRTPVDVDRAGLVGGGVKPPPPPPKRSCGVMEGTPPPPR